MTAWWSPSRPQAVILGLFLCIFYFELPWLNTLVVTVYIFMYNIFLFHLTLNQTNRRSLKYAILEGTYNLFFISLFLLLVLVFNQHLFIVLFIAMVSSLLLTEFLRMTVLPEGRVGLDPSRIYFNAGFSKQVFNFGFPITIWLFLSYFLNISDRFIIKEFTSYENVGTYSAIKDFIIKIATFSTVPILLAYHPMIVEKWNSNRREEALKLIREGLMYCFLIAIVVFVVFMVFQDIFYERILHLQVMRQFLVSASLIGSAFLWQAAMLLHYNMFILDYEAGVSYARLIASKEWAEADVPVVIDPVAAHFNGYDLDYLAGLSMRIGKHWCWNMRYEYSIVPVRPWDRVLPRYSDGSPGQHNETVCLRLVYLL